ncbi:hypothetical protein ABIA43_000870 [Bradyrhizobium sp. USDA 328]|jgi:hypothetical protein
MPGLVPGIHVLCAAWQGVDGRDKPAMTTWRLGRPACTAFAGHDSIRETHGPAKVAKIPCLIVIGFSPNLV